MYKSKKSTQVLRQSQGGWKGALTADKSEDALPKKRTKYLWENKKYAELLTIEDQVNLTSKLGLIEPEITSASTLHFIQINLFIEAIEQLLFEGKMSLNEPEKYQEEFPGKPKYAVRRLAGLENLRKSLESKKISGAQAKPFEKEADILLYSWRLFKDKMDQSNSVL